MHTRLIKPLIGVPEQWKRYKNTDYYISDQGRVKHRFKNGIEYEVGFFDTRHSNKQMVCKIDGIDTRISKLVYETWIGKIPKGVAVVHKNGLKKDNSVYNLKLMKFEELGKMCGSKARSQKVYSKENNKIYKSARAVERHLPISRQTVADICNGKTKKPCMDLYWYNEEEHEIYRGKYRKEA